MVITTKKVKQYNSTYKHILLIEGNPVAIFDSPSRMAEGIKYVEGYDADINDGAVRKALEPYRKPVNNIKTEKKKKRKEKALHHFSEEEK